LLSSLILLSFLARKLAMQKLEEAMARAKEGYEDERDAEDDLNAAADDDAGNEGGSADGADVDPQRAKKFTLVGISDVVKFRERKVSSIVLSSLQYQYYTILLGCN